MYEIHGLTVGDRVTVSYQGRNYESVVQDIPAADTLVIAHPSYQSVFLTISDNDIAEVAFAKDNGILTFNAVQGSRRVVDNIPLLTLKAVSEITRKQRRNYFRLDKSLPVQVTVKKSEDDDKPTVLKGHSVNISGNGCKLAIRQPLDQDKQVECKIMLSQDIEVVVDGQVVWSDKATLDRRNNHIGVHFTIEDEVTQRTLVRYITIEQRKKLKIDR
jgi:c-di-GMP-binding flagellar brake protein YcgR